MRCRACDAVMTMNEMVIREETGDFEDLCRKCIIASKLGDEDSTVVEADVGIIRRRDSKWAD